MIFSSNTQLMCGILLITVPTIAYGGSFLLRVLSGSIAMPFTAFQKSMFRAGHAHAGVLVLLALIVQPLIEAVGYPLFTEWLLRASFGAAAMLVSGGFFAAAGHKNAEKPNKWIMLVWIGAVLLSVALFILGLGLILN
ncbi:MAG: hypothetical protein MUC87_13785 [Bacteroidia bacterium]|jgi:hypothetical protein|nr:hypothetical protein [Bacteroidia bacterium]